MGPPATSTKRATLVRELFGDGTMSDSDFMDTPVKTASSCRSQANVVPISQAKNEVSVESMKINSSGEKRPATPSKTNDKPTVRTDTDVAVPNQHTNVNQSKSEETKDNDSNPISSNSKDDNLIIEESNNSEARAIEDNSSIKVATATKVLVGDDSNSTECPKYQAQSITIDAHSQSDEDDDDGDDYDDCTLISSLPSANMSNRIYQNVISNLTECPMKLTRVDLDLRPVSTYLNDRKIVIKTCDEFILYSSPPSTDLPSTSSTTVGATKNVIKKRTNAKTVDGSGGMRKVEERYKKVPKLSYDGSDNVVPEKNARFHIVAKHKGPIDHTTSAPTSSRCVLTICVFFSKFQTKFVNHFSRDQRKLSQPSEVQPNASTLNEMKKSNQQKPPQQNKIPPLLKDMDINKVLEKIHPSKEIA